MGMLRKAAIAAIAAKVIDEARKPENQQRLRALVDQARSPQNQARIKEFIQTRRPSSAQRPG